MSEGAIDWRARHDAVKADRDALARALMADLEAVYGQRRTVYRVGSTLCCTCGARSEDTPPRPAENRVELTAIHRCLDAIEKRLAKLEAAKGGEE